MSASTSKSDYMLLFRGTNWDKGLSPEQIQKVTGEFMAWFERLRSQGTVSSGHPLTNSGKTVSGKKGRTVADGPFAESKEAVGGYFLLHVSSMDEAVEIAKGCPALEHGLTVEVRQIAEQCPVMDRAQDLLAQASA